MFGGGLCFFDLKTWLAGVKTTALVTVAENQGEQLDPLTLQLFNSNAEHAVGSRWHSGLRFASHTKNLNNQGRLLQVGKCCT